MYYTLFYTKTHTFCREKISSHTTCVENTAPRNNKTRRLPGLCCVFCYQQGVGAVSAPNLAFDVIELEFASGAPGASGLSGQRGSSTCSHLVFLPGHPGDADSPDIGGHRYRKLMNILQQASLRQAWVWEDGNREFPQTTHPAGLRG